MTESQAFGPALALLRAHPQIKEKDSGRTEGLHFMDRYAADAVRLRRLFLCKFLTGLVWPRSGG